MKPLTARTKQKIKSNIVGYLYVMPVILGVLIFTAFPVLYAFIASFFDSTTPALGDLGAWNGLKNYTINFTNVLYSEPFWQSLGTTFLYALISIPLNLLLGFLLAVLLNQDLKGMRVFRVLYYLPVLIPPIASGLLWGQITNDNYGILTKMFESVGITDLKWFSTTASAMGSFIFVGLFTLGGNMILWLAQLKNVPKSLYESARLDGAGRFRQLISVTIPMCTPMILYNTIMSIIGVLQIYSQVVMLGDDASENLKFYVFTIYGNKDEHFGIACALSFILFLITAALTALVMKTSKWVYYTEEG